MNLDTLLLRPASSMSVWASRPGTLSEGPTRPDTSLSVARPLTRGSDVPFWATRPNTARSCVSDSYGFAENLERPVRLEKVNAELIEQLERLASDRGPSRQSSCRPLSGKQRSVLASSLVDEANQKLTSFLSKSAVNRVDDVKGPLGGLAASSMAIDHEAWEQEVQGRYQELVAGIDQASSGGAPLQTHNAPSIIFRPGSVLEETLEANTSLLLTLPLPRRKVEVVVNMVRLSGGVPGLYGSDIETRPSSKHSDLEAEGGEIVYRYDPDAQGGAAPKTALYFCVEAGDQSSSFRLRSAVRRLAENSDGANEVVSAASQSAVKRVERKLAAIRTDNLTRQSFDERLKEAHRHLNSKRRNVVVQNFQKVNRTKLKEFQDEGTVQRNKRIAWQQYMRIFEVEKRREIGEAAREDHMMWWLQKHDLRRMEREEQERLNAEAMQSMEPPLETVPEPGRQKMPLSARTPENIRQEAASRPSSRATPR
eukprot:TRINITY_DN36979_c0_g1_i1.p1 TRINITY_DN36979_c0_g1~~TRINITY_DN36979_c0_g1_i1.p1  ORF type:complete len:481 (+),score=88.37 TRINITY_DN36979_c0_g1_i1:31-1473(+)